MNKKGEAHGGRVVRAKPVYLLDQWELGQLQGSGSATKLKGSWVSLWRGPDGKDASASGTRPNASQSMRNQFSIQDC
jgi:hypothetical protein